MDSLVDKISEYQIFNYLFPGVIFCLFATKLGVSNLLVPDVLLGLFFYYFAGLVISRLGSLVVEPVAKSTKLVMYASYKSFLSAVKDDPKIDVLVESANTFRTLSAGFILLAASYFVTHFQQCIASILNGFNGVLLVLLVLAVLFLASYKKQVSYVRRRVEK